MSNKIKSLGVFTSGGDAPGMNACIRAVVRTALHYGLKVHGIQQGYEGMIDGEIDEMQSHSVSNIIQKGGTILKSARSERFMTEDGRKLAYESLKEHGIESLVAIGGDGTFRGAYVFANEFEVPIVGVPGTIDNDLYGTDVTIGYDTAINTAVEAIDKIRDTAASHNRLFFIEVMGKDAGFIALRTGIAGGAEAILIPEEHTDSDQLIETLHEGFKKNKTSSIVVVAEGDESGGALKIADGVKKQVGEYDTRVTILGHLQRGGSPSCMDRVLASTLGVAAVEGLLNSKKAVMVGLINKEITFTPFEKATKHHLDINKELVRIARILSS